MRNGGVTDSLDLVVIALCLDYWRRDKIIRERSAERRTDTEFRYLNFYIYDAAAEIVGEGLAEIFIKEIGEKIGYANSAAFDHMSEATYKIRKKRVKDRIAEKLHLTDAEKINN